MNNVKKRGRKPKNKIIVNNNPSFDNVNKILDKKSVSNLNIEIFLVVYR